MVGGEIFLSAFIQVLFEKLASRDLWNFALKKQIHTQLAKWSRMLEQIEALLADAEDKQMTNQRGITLWLEDLEDLAYDLNDVLDEFATEALRRKMMEEPRASTSKVHAFIPTCCVSFNPSTLVSGSSMSSKIKEITNRLQDLFDRRIGLGLQNVHVERSVKAPQRPPTSSLIHEPSLYGRDGDKRSIIELLLTDQSKGLIEKPTGQKQMEDLECEYFRELLSRSFFQPSSSDEVSLFVMHDLINELAQFVARRVCFRMEDKLKDNERGENIIKARHSSYTRGYLDGIKKFEPFHKAKNLRTFLPLGLGDRSKFSSNSYLSSDVALHLLPNLKRLRVLSLRRYRIYELSSLIGDLKHVRFLDLSCALIDTLPESISALYNLQTLMLRYCKNLKKLPPTTGNLINLRHLDVTGADLLEEMPPKIGKLISLQTLSNFIVSKGNGSAINELAYLIHLRGTLCISGLEHVADARDAARANLKDKQGLEILLMKWSNSDNSHNESVESEVLDILRPHKKLKELTISGYHSPKFPTWVGNSSFSNMVCLKILNCEKCMSLPTLGQLPSLTKLHIQGMKAVENVGLEFYGSGCSNPFPSLKVLTFVDMPEWKHWSPFGVEERAQAFARLAELSIKRCPKLLQKLPSNLPCLRKLNIEECPGAWVPSQTELNEASSLKYLRVEKIQGLTWLASWFFLGLLTRLQELKIFGCTELKSLWKNEVRIHHRLPALRRLQVEGCPQLISLFEEEEGLWQHEELPHLIMLEYLEIEDCEKLEKLPQGLHNLKCLRKLILDKCPCLVSFPKKGLPPTLRTLDIYKCEALRSLPDQLEMLNSLEELKVRKCPWQKNFSCSRTRLPPTLKELKIKECGDVESILAEEGMKIDCPSLEYVIIMGCPRLKSLPDVMQNNNDGCLRSLSQLHITNCDNLESVPEGWFTATNLRELCILSCKKLKRLPHHAYEDNLTCLHDVQVDSCAASATGLVPYILNKESSSSYSYCFTNVTFLRLHNVDMGGKPPSEWGLHRLHFLNLEKLSCKDFLNLPYLEKLEFCNCPNLTTIIELGQLTSLSELWIEDCPNLTCQLPPSLLWLEMKNCPLLKQRYEKGKGQYWPLISHIPQVNIDDKDVSDPSS
ncbi:hypothetical protein RHSIM_Rhsim06G0066400 [Rhododendron simsii]|uniref:Rx N-terminal domain-containing protein n=1 Tax=Rhododendron simsii TaxID=118357 RepID=A0A834LNE8_RHOSS|nr:hypothetical protein RHSIM_Rhsim06G0066400 [Rhododendron simsii]